MPEKEIVRPGFEKEAPFHESHYEPDSQRHNAIADADQTKAAPRTRLFVPSAKNIVSECFEIG